MVFILAALKFALYLFMLTLFARMIISWVMVFSRDWRPSGVMLVVVESVLTVTDPPLRALRGVIPPLRMGGVQLDLAFLVLFIGCIVVDGLLSQVIMRLT
ncbi:YggT family protein [Demequina globuliformis]|uniref:YggT family protein n=1 Tax=Demequina globuliformis TaxID=676202 RepID=UPI000A02C65F|nr:YggT family protein [Demequina globuliformis]